MGTAHSYAEGPVVRPPAHPIDEHGARRQVEMLPCMRQDCLDAGVAERIDHQLDLQGVGAGTEQVFDDGRPDFGEGGR